MIKYSNGYWWIFIHWLHNVLSLYFCLLSNKSTHIFLLSLFPENCSRIWESCRLLCLEGRLLCRIREVIRNDFATIRSFFWTLFPHNWSWIWVCCSFLSLEGRLSGKIRGIAPSITWKSKVILLRGVLWLWTFQFFGIFWNKLMTDLTPGSIFIWKNNAVQN